MAQPGNLLSDNNESYETSVAGWVNTQSTTLSNSSSQAYMGTKSCLMTSSAASPLMIITSATSGDQPQGLTVGATYDVWGWVFTTVSGRTAYWTIDWRTSGNVFISSSDQIGSPVSLVANTWTLVQFKTGAAPSTTTQATLNFNVSQSATSQQFFLDYVFFGTQRPRLARPNTQQSIVRSNFW